MKITRRRLLEGGTLGLLGAGSLGRVEGVTVLQPPVGLTRTLHDQATGAGERLLLGPQDGEAGPPAPADYDRLPLPRNKRTVARFKALLAERDIEAFLVRQPLNTIHLTGYWHTTTGRPEATCTNHDDEDPRFLHLGLDRDRVRSCTSFSEEPGLHDPKSGCDSNWNDTAVVGEVAGYRLSRVAYSEA